MPGRKGVFARAERDTRFGGHILAAIQAGYGTELDYFGIETQERAREVRLGMVRSGKHHEVSVRAYYTKCAGCEHGGPTCRFHVKYTAYDPAVALAYKRKQDKIAAAMMRGETS